MNYRNVLTVLGIVMLTGCQSVPRQAGELEAGLPVESSTPPPMPFPEPEGGAQELDEDLVFSYLVGEIGARRGDLRLAMSHYLMAAQLAKDPYAAERATRIAMHVSDTEAAMRAVRRWVELAPNSLDARKHAVILFMRNAQLDLAAEELRALVSIAEALDEDGFEIAAVTLGRETDTQRVLTLMQGVAAEYAGDARAHYALALVLTAQRQFHEAEARLRNTLTIDPAMERAHILLSRVLIAQGDADRAIEHLTRSVDALPDDELLRMSLARQLVNQKRYAEAIGQFRELRKRNPENEEVLYALAMLATQEELWKEARPLWQQLRGNSDRYNEATYFLAQIEEANDQTELAIGLYAAVKPGDYRVDAVMRSAQLLGAKGRLGEARDILQQARVAYAARAEDLYIAETQMLQKHATPEVVLAVYEEALAAYPDSNDLLYNRALFKNELGDPAAMEADLRLILERDPDHADALNALGYTLADQRRQLDEAYTYVARALRLRPDNPAILDSMGWVLYRMGDHARAVGYLRRALSDAPDDEIAAHLGEVLWVSGEQEEALDVWRQALELKPDSKFLKAVMERLQAVK